MTAIAFRSSVKQPNRHTFAISRQVLARVMMKAPHLQRKEGAEKAGCPLHPQPRTQKERTSARTCRYRRNTRLSLRNGFNAYFVLSPVSGLLLATVASARDCSPTKAQHLLRGARTTRLHRPRAMAANDLLGTSYTALEGRRHRSFNVGRLARRLGIAYESDPPLSLPHHEPRIGAPDALASTAFRPASSDDRETPLVWDGTIHS